MKKIALVGLTGWENYGEQFLAKTVNYLVGDKYETKFVDFRPTKKGLNYLLFGLLTVLVKILPWKKRTHFLTYLSVKCLSKKYFERELNDCDAILFACGSFKYGTQKLWAYYSVAIDVAAKRNIPVMLNAMNIQDYDESDWRCRCLKEHVNNTCVKMFTTRDGKAGVEKLQRDYLYNKGIQVQAVGDPAFWIPETYAVASTERSDVIGVNLIRGNIFRDYGYHLTEEQLIDFYCGLLGKLDENKEQWELFTNGLHVDYILGEKVLKKLGKEDRKIRVPQADYELVDMISQYKAIFGTRLHACICAYSLDVPMVGCIWDEKLIRFAEIAKLEDIFLQESEMECEQKAEIAYERLKKAFDFRYDAEQRAQWKEKTQSTIQSFLSVSAGHK